MKFVVTFKGVRWYCGILANAYGYIEQKWGSFDAAWAMGVKLAPALEVERGR